MISKVYSSALIGLDPSIVEVEVDIRRGLSSFNIVGLPDKAISEAKERITSAIKNSGCEFPKGRVVVNLAPADLPKSGSIYDLPIAVGILQASNQISFDFKSKIFLGELSLNGEIRRINGVLPILSGLANQISTFYIPNDNNIEASIIKNTNSFYLSNFAELVDHIKNGKKLPKVEYKEIEFEPTDSTFNLKHIIGQYHAKRALEIAAAGGHNLLFTGVPGSGKTYLSKCITSILPKLDQEERLEITKIYSIAGRLQSGVVTSRPFRSPHTTSSDVSLIGGGKIPKPGEVTLAHKGVLFLDEFPEFSNNTLESLRQPLEDKVVTVSRASGSVNFPADFMLLAAMNPCKCGFRGDPDRECVCSETEVMKYQKKISGPIMDRIDLQVIVPRVKIGKLIKNKIEEESEIVKNRVEEVRKIQIKRYKSSSCLNANVNNEMVRKYVKLSKSSLELLKTAVDSFNLSARSYYKVLKVARTIADLDNSEGVKKDHIAEALSYRI